MSKPIIHFNNYISLAVMLLMVVALVAGQAGASDQAAEEAISVAPIEALEDRLNIDLRGHIGEQGLNISIAVAADLSHFRGEDE
ncbi:MAG: hypothetical protein GWP67_04135 [Gammaproteobacteria bacterium]|jgi:hypothetical protein|nr:hypothetical protein [Gammaproteobacteria bacterium]